MWHRIIRDNDVPLLAEGRSQGRRRIDTFKCHVVTCLVKQPHLQCNIVFRIINEQGAKWYRHSCSPWGWDRLVQEQPIKTELAPRVAELGASHWFGHVTGCSPLVTLQSVTLL